MNNFIKALGVGILIAILYVHLGFEVTILICMAVIIYLTFLDENTK